MMNADSALESFVYRVRDKFGIRTRFKLKVRDEGDLITMGDIDDWAMAVEGVRRELEGNEGGGEMGKMEVCIILINGKPYANEIVAQVWIQEIL